MTSTTRREDEYSKMSSFAHCSGKMPTDKNGVLIYSLEILYSIVEM